MLKGIVKSVYWGFYNFKVLFCNSFARMQVKSMGKACKFHKFCRLTANTVIGNNCHFNGINIQGKGLVKIGDNFHSGVGVYIISSDHNYDEGEAIPYDDSFITKDVIIDDNVWVGINVIILRGTHLGEGSIIQAGSVVCDNIPPYAIAGGHPAKVFKYRDIEHYKRLLSDSKFF